MVSTQGSVCGEGEVQFYCAAAHLIFYDFTVYTSDFTLVLCSSPQIYHPFHPSPLFSLPPPSSHLFEALPVVECYRSDTCPMCQKFFQSNEIWNLCCFMKIKLEKAECVIQTFIHSSRSKIFQTTSWIVLDTKLYIATFIVTQRPVRLRCKNPSDTKTQFRWHNQS